MFWSSLLLALREIRRNLMRSALTTLGIVIGVAAVITMVTLGSGATARVTADISGLGRNLLVVQPGSNRPGGPPNLSAPAFDLADVRALGHEISGLAAIAPVATRTIQAVYGNKNWSTSIIGTDNAYLTVREWPLQLGRGFTEGELLAGKLTCLLGATLHKELFGTQNPLDASIRLGKLSCRVIGVLAAKGQSTFGTDQDDLIILPLLAFQRRIAGNRDVNFVMVSAQRSGDTPSIQQDIEQLLRQRRHITEGEEDDFRVSDMKEIAGIVERTTGVLTAFLGAIAAVSLLVGGIGIMNIMLVSVTERTREIGIRLAIGALEREVLLQFLVEAVLLSAFGGVLGIALGIGASAIAAHFLDLPLIFDPLIVIVAFVFSGGVGIVFGYFPARKAARLDPIDALRHE